MTVLAVRPPRIKHAPGFWFVAVAFLSLMAFGTVPTPLWPLYQARDHFGATTVTVAFAIMVVGTGLSLGLLGHLSDRFGRRRIIAPALLVGIASAIVLAAWPDVPGLLVGRILTGVALGLMASTATPYLADLYHEAYPERTGSPVPGLVATAANLGGLAVGPLFAGIMAQWVPAPLVTSYVVLAVIMAVLLLLVLSSPETVDTELVERPSRFALKPGQKSAFGSAAMIGFFSFALLGLFSSLGSVMVRGELGITSTFILGLAPFTAFAASALGQLALGSVPRRKQLVIGAWLFPIGLGVTAMALAEPALGTFLAGAALAGGGAGLLFKGAVTQTAMAAEPASRAGVLATFFIISYIGMGLPAIGFSMVIKYAAMAPTMIGFGAVLSLGTIAAVAVAIRRNNPRVN